MKNGYSLADIVVRIWVFAASKFPSGNIHTASFESALHVEIAEYLNKGLFRVG